MSYVNPTGTLSMTQAKTYASYLERKGWRAEPLLVLGGVGRIEVRDLSVRWTPLIATLRTHEDVYQFRDTHPEHGLIGRVPTTSEAGMKADAERTEKGGPRPLYWRTLKLPDGFTEPVEVEEADARPGEGYVTLRVSNDARR